MGQAIVECEPKNSISSRAQEGAEENLRLLQRVAQERDPEAFTRLFQRFEAPVFALAYRIVGNRVLAEEAAQEAMLHVWRSAASFQRAGSVRSWIFCIVAHESLQICQRRKREQKRAEIWHAGKNGEEEPVPASAAEQEEQLSALGRLVEELPEVERQLLALYHGAGLTQEEISTALAIPRRTVAAKLQKGLEFLRMGLVRAGVAAAAPLLTSDRLCEALCAGVPAPQGLRQQTLDRLGEPQLAYSQRAIAQASTGLSAKAILWASCTAAFLGSAGMAWRAHQERAQTVVAEPETKLVPPTAREIPSTPGAEESLNLRWTFENGPPPDWQVLLGAWTWEPRSPKEQSVLLVPDRAWVLMPTRIPPRPVEVACKVEAGGPGNTVGFSAMWTRAGSQGQVLKNLRTRTKQFNPLIPVNSLDARCLFLKQYSFTYMSGLMCGINEYQSEYPSDCMVISFTNLKLREISLRTLNPEELPAQVKDPRALIKSLNAEPEVLEPVIVRPSQSLERSK